MDWDRVVRVALDEDVGSGDATTDSTVDATARARATITQKAPGVIFGIDGARAAFAALDPAVEIERLVPEGVWHEPGTEVLRATATARALLTAERTALNLLGRLSGVATLTARFVAELDGTGVRVLDTRKTTPGLRELEKAAVVAGGGVNHRVGLYDAILIKENHIAAAGGIAAAVERARAAHPDLLLEVECRDAGEVDQALAAGVGRILLDNMTPQQLDDVVQRVDGRAELEASGAVTLDTLREIASTGVQFVSVGALTHSAPALDLSLILEPLS